MCIFCVTGRGVTKYDQSGVNQNGSKPGGVTNHRGVTNDDTVSKLVCVYVCMYVCACFNN